VFRIDSFDEQIRLVSSEILLAINAYRFSGGGCFWFLVLKSKEIFIGLD